MVARTVPARAAVVADDTAVVVAVARSIRPNLCPQRRSRFLAIFPNPGRFANLAALETLAAEISSGGGEPLVLDDLYTLTLGELTAFARREGIAFEGAPNRRTLQAQIFAAAAAAKRPILDRGYIDVTDRGAFIVHAQGNYRLYPDDAYLPESLVNRYGLEARPPCRSAGPGAATG